MHRSILAGAIAAIIGSTLLWADGINIPFSFPATTCTNQFIRSIAVSTGVGTCATVGTSDLASSLSLTTPNINVATATSINFGGSTLNTYTATTWTPAITTDGTVGTPAYTVQLGSYEQIGRQVTARFNIQLSGWTGSPTGGVAISGLPVTSTSTANDFGYCFVNTYVVTGLSALSYGITARVGVSGTTAVLGSNASTAGGSAIAVTAAQFGTTGIIEGICFYRTN